MRCNYYLRNPDKKGRTAIYMSASYQGQRCILFPGESIDTRNWINDKDRRVNKPKPITENNALIGRLNRFEQLVRDTHDDLQKSVKGVVPEMLLTQAVNEKIRPSESAREDKPKLIIDFFQTMIDDSTSGKRKSQEGKHLTVATISTYETTKRHIEDYQTKHRKKYYLSGIDQKLIDGFSDYLTHDLKMAFNGSGKYMKTFRTMMNYARQLKMIGADVLIDNKVKVTHESPDNIYLTEKDIADLYAIKEFDSPTQKIVLELFIIGCLTGLRFSDYSTLSKARFNNGFMFLTQQKTQNRVTIPIHSTVQEILAKYPGGLPKCPPNQVFNRYLKDLGKKLPQLDTDFDKVLTRGGVADPKTYKKYELLQSHTARRSFATNEYLNGTPTITIMAITGHRTEKSFLAYIKADSLQHAMLLAEHWKKRKKDNDGAAGVEA